MPPTPTDVTARSPAADDPSHAADAALQAWLERLNARPDLPAMSRSIRRIVELSSSEHGKLDNLAAAILQDYALTARVLRLVNSPAYRHAGQPPIGTMARAVMLLGLETVRTLAMSAILLEHLNDRGHAKRLREAFVCATLCGALARDLAARIGLFDEDVWLCGMFHRLGRMLALYHFPNECEEIAPVAAHGDAAEADAVRHDPGIRWDALGMAVARQWGFAPAVIASMAPLPAAEPVPRAIGRDTRLHVLASLSDELLDALARCEGRERQVRLERIARRYGRATGITGTEMRAALAAAADYAWNLAEALALDLPSLSIGQRIAALRRDAGAAAADVEASDASARPDAAPAEVPNASVVPVSSGASSSAAGAPHAGVVLANGLAELSRALADGCSLNDATRLSLEILYRGLALQRVLFALRDPHTDVLTGRLGVGAGLPGLLQRFRVPLARTGDLFSTTATRGVDLLIADATVPGVAAALPDWFPAFGAGSFLLLPMTVRGSAVAMIYGDRATPLAEPPDQAQASLVGAIRNRLLQAIQPSR